MEQQLFTPGQIVATPGAFELADHGIDLLSLLLRQLSGDWGDIGKEDEEENDFSYVKGFRIISAYQTDFGRLWIITEADRFSTTLLLPSEY